MAAIELRRKLQSTQDSKKITAALQLVAASKMKGFVKKAKSSHTYAGQILRAVVKTSEKWDEWLLGQKPEGEKVMFVLMTANKGLCGALNQRLVNKLNSSELWNKIPTDKRMLITIGRKGYEFARRKNWVVHHHFADLKETLGMTQAFEVIEMILAWWKSGEIGQVVVVSADYINPFVAAVVERTYLPVTKEMLERRGFEMVESDGAVYMEPDVQTLLEEMTLQLTQALLYQAFFELKAAEYSSRMVAMKKATEAADERIGSLVVAYNKARQAAITQELSELSAAAEAMSS